MTTFWEAYDYCMDGIYPQWVKDMKAEKAIDDYCENNDGQMPQEEQLKEWIEGVADERK